MGPSIRYRKSVHEKEVVVQKATEIRNEISEGWSPDIVVGIDFGMTYTGKSSSPSHEYQASMDLWNIECT